MYAEVRNDYYDSEEGKVFIDAWETDDGDEEGSVVAKVDVATKGVEYLDPAARTDPYAQELITDALRAIEDGIYSEN